MDKLSFRKIINNVRKPGASLTHRVVVSGFWVFALRILQKAFGFIRLIVLARVLAPDDFGLMGIALLTMSALETFSQSGFQHALIQKKENIDSYLNSAWTVSVLRGIIIFVILYLIAPYVATFFNATEAKSIIRIIGLSVLIKAFTNIGVIYFKKDFEFNKQFIYELAGALADFIVSVSAALILRNVWALVFGLLAGDLAMCCLSYFLHPHRPRLNFDLGKLKELWGFGRWIFSSSILIFLVTQGDDIFVGKFLGVTMLGFYQIAYRVSNTSATEISHIISRVTFPAYSKLQEDLSRLKEAYIKVLQVTMYLSFPIAGLIFVLAPDFAKIFLGEKWMPMVPALRVLCIYGVARAFGATAGTLFQGVGKPSILTYLAIIDLTLMILLIYPLTSKYGILGTSIAVLTPSLITQFIVGVNVLNIIKYSSFKFVKVFLLPLIYTIIVILPLYVFTSFCQYVNFFVFMFLIFYFVAGYLWVLYLFKKNVFFNAYKNIENKDFKI